MMVPCYICGHEMDTESNSLVTHLRSHSNAEAMRAISTCTIDKLEAVTSIGCFNCRQGQHDKCVFSAEFCACQKANHQKVEAPCLV